MSSASSKEFFLTGTKQPKFIFIMNELGSQGEEMTS